jgi:hypothetical protein
MISRGDGNDPYQSVRLRREGGGGKRRLTAAIARFCSAGMYRHVWARAEADIETCSFDFRACVVP